MKRGKRSLRESRESITSNDDDYVCQKSLPPQDFGQKAASCPRLSVSSPTPGQATKIDSFSRHETLEGSRKEWASHKFHGSVIRVEPGAKFCSTADAGLVPDESIRQHHHSSGDASSTPCRYCAMKGRRGYSAAVEGSQ